MVTSQHVGVDLRFLHFLLDGSRYEHVIDSPSHVAGARIGEMRPPRVVAIALREQPEGIDEAGIEIPEAEDDEVEKFREFLDQVNPDDFVTGEEPKS